MATLAVKLRTTILPGDEDLSDEQDAEEANTPVPKEGLREEAVEQLERDIETRKEIQKSGLASTIDTAIHSSTNGAAVLPPSPAIRQKRRSRRFDRFRKIVELGKSKKTTRLIIQIWQSDYSVIAFVLVMISFYLMKDLRYPPVGVLFFLLAMATVDAILSIFVVRLSFHQNKHGFYRTEDFERDWLRYRILLSMTKAALIFIVGTTCGVAAAIAAYIMWFFTSTQRLRYFILRWSMDEHYPDLQRWSIFALLREAGIEPKRKNFNWVAAIGVVIGFTIAFIF